MFWQLTYGSWTLVEFMEYMFISQNCREILAMSLVSYQLALILGCYCCINFLFITIILILLTPYLLYRLRNRTQIYKNLMSVQYESSRFRSIEECLICLEEFTSDQKCMVTPLPCQNTTLHIFHTECIKLWLAKELRCPLCKDHVHQYNTKELKSNFNQRYPVALNILPSMAINS